METLNVMGFIHDCIQYICDNLSYSNQKWKQMMTFCSAIKSYR